MATKCIVTYRYAMDYEPTSEPNIIRIGDLTSVRIYTSSKMILKWSQPLYWMIGKPSTHTFVLMHRLTGSQCQFNVMHLKVCHPSAL